MAADYRVETTAVTSMSVANLLLDLTRRYCEPHRHYHGLPHIADMLFRGRGLDLNDVQILSIWYHDAIYDPRSESNEEDSAALARTHLESIDFDRDSIGRLEAIVLDTKRHVPSTAEAAPVIDLDLSSIGADWSIYERNRDNIRREYEWVPQDEFDAGTRKFLEGMLKRDRIFFTDWGSQFEPKARENMQRALAAMAS